MMDRAFCPACGVVVEPVSMTVGDGVESEEVTRCPTCGFVFPGGEGAPVEAPLYARVAVADDMEHVRKAVARALLAQRLAGTVDEFADGGGFIAAVRRLSATGDAYQLAILDLHMPIIDGLKAALALRQLERQLGWSPTPILFFSAIVCDERLRGHLAALGPGFYLNKGVVAVERDLGERLRDVLAHLARRGG
ncbi:MAG: response regulator [Deltaproteobacteria bacterium]|nr:response regulator [Deltaproteobacteria bacterium]